MSDIPPFRKTMLSIGAASLVANISVAFWIPFLPLYLLELGAKDSAEAVFWLAVATAGQGVTRLFAGPFWGILSDRIGRKFMFVRAMYSITLATAIAALITEPWQIAFTFAAFGLLAGFNPAGVALSSVLAPAGRMNDAIRWVTSAQYLGNTIGPAIGSGLAIAFGYRGAIIIGGIAPAIMATMVIFLVPKDEIARQPPRQAAKASRRGERNSIIRILTVQFGLALMLNFILWSIPQALRILTPSALQEIGGSEAAKAWTGLAFTIGGVASVAGITLVAGRFVRPGRMRLGLTAIAALMAAGQFMLGLADTIWLFIAGYALLSLLFATMNPAVSHLVAASVDRSQRGTAFGLASSAQALAMVVGPGAAAVFAAVSIGQGFLLLGIVMLGVAAVLLATLQEPRGELEPVASAP